MPARSQMLWMVTASLCFLHLSNAPALSQTMSFSFYTNMTIDSGGRVYADVTAYDNSSGCSHSGYSMNVSLSGPLGGSASAWGQMSASASLANGDGDYLSTAVLRLTCSCMNYSVISVGGGGTRSTRTQFRAVFDYKQANGNKHQYDAKCTHSCQPSRVCIAVQSPYPPYAFFGGYKLVTPAATRCSQSTPIVTSTSYNANPCLGTGVGLWTSYDSGCQF